jgi:hypothetical protein
MSRPHLSLLRRLHRSLAYSTVDALAGISVQVHSAETAPDDVLGVVKRALSINVTTMAPDLDYREGAIAKYGILDLTFGIGSTSSEIPRPGLGILRPLGLVDGGEGADALEVSDDFLRDLTLESEAGHPYLKVFLETQDALPPRDSLRRLREGMPAGFWPHLFVVRDACLTNTPSIWLAKHFYM